MKKFFAVALFSVLIQSAFAGPHGSDARLSASQFVGRWYMASGSTVRDDGSAKMLDADQEKTYYTFAADGRGKLTRAGVDTAFAWRIQDEGLVMLYQDGYTEIYTSATFFSSTALSLSGRFDYYQSGQPCIVTLALYARGSLFYQE
jgi:hypothetical protein